MVSRPGPTKDVAKSTHLIQAQMQPSTRQSIPFKSSNTSSHGYYSQPISKQSLPGDVCSFDSMFVSGHSSHFKSIESEERLF